MFLKCTPEQKYYSALRLLQGWNDKNIAETGCSKLNTVEIIKMKDPELYAQMCQKIIDMTMSRLYNDLDKDQASRMRATLMENLRNMKTNEMMTFLKEAYLEHENVINSLECEIPPHHPRFPQQRVIINYS